VGEFARPSGDKQDKLREKMDKLRVAQADLAGLKG
jgi:hypothetical protein